MMDHKNFLNMPGNVGSESLWDEDIPKRDFKKVSASVMRLMGLSKNSVQHVDNVDDLRKTPPNIIIAEVVKDIKFVQNWFKEQVLVKKKRYVMGLGVFQQLHYDQRGVKILKPTNLRFKNIYRPYLGQDANDKTILVFRTGGIGDLLFIQPNLIYLKNKYSNCSIKFACGPQYQPMVENWDCVDEVLDLPFLVKNLIESDYHVLFEGVIERCRQAERDNAYNLFSRWLGLDLPDELLIPFQEPKEELVSECVHILGEEFKLKVEDGFIVIQLRASSPIRTPRHEFWIKIINALNKRGMNVVLTDNPRQADNIEKFINMLDDPSKTFNFCKHSKSIDYSIALTSLSKGTVATDSAISHIAASLDVPCYGIFGPFPGEIRLKTYPKGKWVDAKRHCAPCFMHGQNPCPQAKADGYSPCYDELIDTNEKLDELANKIEEHLK